MSTTTGFSSLTAVSESNRAPQKSLTKLSTFDSSAIFDLYVRCKRCEDYVPLFQWIEHKRLHKLLDIYGWKRSPMLPSDNELYSLRQRLLKKYQSSDPAVNLTLLEKINESFDFLRSMQDGQERMSRFMAAQPVLRDYVCEELSSCLPCVSACGVSTSDPTLFTSYEPQAFSIPLYHDGFGGLDSTIFLAICDAFDGPAAADVTVTWIQKVFLELSKNVFPFRCSCAFNMFDHADNYLTSNADKNQKSKLHPASLRLPHVSPAKNLVKKIYFTCSDTLDEKVLQKVHERLGKRRADITSCEDEVKRVHHLLYEYLDYTLSYGVNETSQHRWSGCSLSTIFISAKSTVSWRDVENSKAQFDTSAEPQHLADLYVSNVGNVSVLLIRGNRVVELSKDDSILNRKQRFENILQVSHFTSDAKSDKRGDHSEQGENKTANKVDATPLKRALGMHGDTDAKAKIEHSPHYSKTRIDQFCQFLVCASAGLFRCLSMEKVRQLVLNAAKDICSDLFKQLYANRKAASEGESSDNLESTIASRSRTSSARPRSSVNSRASRAQSARSGVSLATTSISLFGDSPRDAAELTPEPTYESLWLPAAPVAEQRATSASKPSSMHESSDSKDGIRQYVADPDEAEQLRRTLARRISEALYRAARLTGCRDALSVTVLLLPGAETLIHYMSAKVAEDEARELAAARERESQVGSVQFEVVESRSTTTTATSSTSYLED